MKKLITLLLSTALFTSVFAGTIDEIPVDDYRGPWLQTIDLDAQEHAYNRITTPGAPYGETAIRFELREGECYTAKPEAPETGWDDCTRDRERAELREFWQAPLDTRVFYGFSVFFPDDYEPMYPKQMFFQWHGGVWGPNAYFHMDKNEFKIDVLTERGTSTSKYNLGSEVLTLGTWHDVVVKANWTIHDTGFLTVYVDGVQVLHHEGPTMDIESYETGIGPNVKFGIYRSHMFRWYDNQEGPPPTHIIWFDEYRRSTMSVHDVVPGEQQGD